MTIAWSAVVTVARSERARRRRAMIAIGLAAGLAGGFVLGGAALLARTSSAPERLVDSVGLGDAHVQVFGGLDLATDIAGLPAVSDAAFVPMAVGRLEGPLVRYAGVGSLPEGPLMSPIVVEGRRPAPEANDEVMVTEQLASELDVQVGDHMTVSMLTTEELTQFDTGFGDPDGATVDLSVTGIARLPPGVAAEGTPLLASSAFAAEHPESIAGGDLFVRLHDGHAGLRAFTESVAEAAAAAAPTVVGTEFLPAVVSDPYAATRALNRSSRVLLGGLLVAVIVAAIASLLVLAQAMARHHASSAVDQRIEAALGMTTFERVTARTLPWIGPALLAGTTSAVVALSAAVLEPVGPLRKFEPEAGWRPEIGIVLVGGLAVVTMMILVPAGAAWRAGRRRHDNLPRSGRTVRALTAIAPRRQGWTLAGAVFAVSSGDGDGPSRVRTSLIGAVVGVTGIVAALTFAGTLDRLISSPERYGWPADLAVVDAQDEDIDGLAHDERFSAVMDVSNATVQFDGAPTRAYSFSPVVGLAGWTYLEGRAPQWSGEVALGTKLADSRGIEIGDQVEIGSAGSLEVVGIGIGPTLNGEPLGSSVLLDPDALPMAATDGIFREALLRLRDGVDASSVVAELGARYELAERSLPTEVRDVADIGRLPEVLGAFLALLGVAAIAHTIVVTTRRRASDLAVLRALGATPGQSGLAVVAMALATMCVGLAIGVPLGWAVARLVWGILADSVGFEAGVVVPPSIGLVILGGLTIAIALAAWPARRIARADPAALLRAE